MNDLPHELSEPPNQLFSTRFPFLLGAFLPLAPLLRDEQRVGLLEVWRGTREAFGDGDESESLGGGRGEVLLLVEVGRGSEVVESVRSGLGRGGEDRGLRVRERVFLGWLFVVLRER